MSIATRARLDAYWARVFQIATGSAPALSSPTDQPWATTPGCTSWFARIELWCPHRSTSSRPSTTGPSTRTPPTTQTGGETTCPVGPSRAPAHTHCRQHPQPEPTTRNPRDSSHPRPVRPATSVGQQRRGGTRQGSAPPVQEAWVITDPHGRPIAAANLTAFDGCPSDIGVLTATGLRGHGLGLHVAAHAASDAIHHCGIAR